MVDGATVPAETASGAVPSRGSQLGRKLLIGVGIVVVAVVGFFLGAAVIPRWWAQRIGGLVDGRMTVGSLAGLAAGAAFTFAPLLLVWAAWKWRNKRGLAIAALVAAILLAAPNLFLLGIVLGDGNAAHAGERILDVEGPGYRGGSLIGVVIAVLAFVWLVYITFSRRRSRERAKRLDEELREQRDEQREESSS